MVDNQSTIVAERGKDPGISTAPHGCIHRVFVFLKCSDYLISHGACWPAGGKNDIYFSLSLSFSLSHPSSSSSPSSGSMCLRGSEAMDGRRERTTWLSELAVKTNWS